jgi:putative MATE family efflux protein
VTAVTTRHGQTASLKRIAALALPALVVLAAEPLYLLVDTAVVGHLGRVPLAGLAIGGTILAVTAWLGNVLAFGTTGRAARSFGAGSRRTAVEEGVQASWLALGAGLALVVITQACAGPVTRALSGDNPAVADGARLWLRIASLGIPFILLVFAGNGWMRGVQDTRRPLRYVLGANVLSAALCPLLVYPAGLGLAGSALANVAAQVIAGGLFVRALVAEGAPLAPHPAMLKQHLVIGRDLLVRGAAFQVCFLSAAAVAARFGAASVAAHQIALQLWMFCAFALDAIAIAAQSLVGAALGAGDVAAAKRTATRIAWLGLACGAVLAVAVVTAAHVLPRLFSTDTAVLDQAAIVWPWFVAMLPLNGVVFALDGVLVGAGDARYLRNLTIFAALCGFLPATWAALLFDLGLGGVWSGLTLFIVLRLAALLARLRDGSWAVPGTAPSHVSG